MEIFIDTANVEEIRKILPWNIISGVTTNQKIFSREKGISFKKRVQEILSLIDGPVSLELTKTDSNDEELVEEAKEYVNWDPKRIVIKVPMWSSGRGLKVANMLIKEGIKVNMTVLMTTNQVFLASRLGTTYASIFFNRIRDAGGDPIKVIKESREIINRAGFKTKIIAGSIRKPEDVIEASVAGTHIVTIPYNVLIQMPYHWKTEETIKEFDKAWREFKQTAIK
jgi:transaldolase